MRPLPLAILLTTALALAACRQDMNEQPKLKTFGAATGFDHNAAARPIPEGTVARESISPEEARTPPPVDAALMARGRERFNVFCSPCHGQDGYGDGMIPQRGFPKPPSFHEPRLRAVTADYVFDVITNGHGVMYGYGDRIPPKDRWAVVAYLRALQLSQHAALADVPDAGEKLP